MAASRISNKSKYQSESISNFNVLKKQPVIPRKKLTLSVKLFSMSLLETTLKQLVWGMGIFCARSICLLLDGLDL